MQKNKTFLSIVILTMGRNADLRELLISILKLDHFGIEIIIIDNSIDSDGKELLHEFHELNINYIENKANLGISKSRNIGINSAKTDYILFLDDDNIFSNNSPIKKIQEDIILMEREGDIGAIRYVTLLKNEEEQYEYMPFELGGEACTLLKNKETFFKKPFYLELDHFATCGVLVSKDSYTKIGGFDENYFMMMEDIDFSTRLWISGYRVLLNLSLSFIHNESRVQRNIEKRQFHVFRNQLLTLYKNYPTAPCLFYMAYWIFILPLFLSFRKQRNSSFDPVLFLVYAYKGIFHFLKLLFGGYIKRVPMSHLRYLYLKSLKKKNLELLRQMLT